MDIFVTIMKIISLFGILTLILSMYIFIVVPTKMSAMFRIALIGNCVTNCSFQIFFSLGIIPVFLLPCFAFYTNGLLFFLGMHPFTQLYILGIIFAVGGWLIVLINLLRAVAVSVYLTERWKTGIISIFCVSGAIHEILCIAFMANVKLPRNGYLSCVELFNNNPPPELFLPETLVVSIEKDPFVAFVTRFYTISIQIYLIISCLITGYLIWSVRRYSAESSSTNFRDSQRSLTLNILKLHFVQTIGLGGPPIGIFLCVLNNVSSTILPKILVLMLSINPLIACILMLRLIPAYRERLNEMCLSILPVGLMNHLNKPQTVSVQVSLNRGINNS